MGTEKHHNTSFNFATAITARMRRYVAIRPSDAENISDSASTGVEPLATKRRRVGVSIACNACRRKKIRVCSGISGDDYLRTLAYKMMI